MHIASTFFITRERQKETEARTCASQAQYSGPEFDYGFSFEQTDPPGALLPTASLFHIAHTLEKEKREQKGSERERARVGNEKCSITIAKTALGARAWWWKKLNDVRLCSMVALVLVMEREKNTQIPLHRS